MSWDVVILDSGEPPQALGPAERVRASISNIVPTVDWSDPAWGTLESEEWSIEFNVGDAPVVESVMLHVRGDGDPLPVIASICATNGWAALDTSTDERLDLAAPSRKGWDDFRALREAVLQSHDETFLAVSGLRIDADRLVVFNENGVVAAHELSRMRDVKFERIVEFAPLLWAAACLGLGMFLKQWIETEWLGWLLAIPLVLLSILFVVTTIFSAMHDTLSFYAGGERLMYPLGDPRPKVDAFRARLLEKLK